MDNRDNLGEQFNILKLEGFSPEEALNKLVSEYNVLLRGSTESMPDGFVRPTFKKETRLFATNLASVAILHAVFSKKGLDYHAFKYPYYIDEDSPMYLTLYGINEKTLCKGGFVYIIDNGEGFLRSPMGSSQYVNHNPRIPYNSKVEVLRKDFNYPVYDGNSNERIQ